MTLMIDLSPDVETKLRDTAGRLGVDVSEYAKRLIEQSLSAAPRPASVHDLFAEWDAEDATDDPNELEARRRDWEEFKEAVNESHPSDRVIYP